MTNKADAGIRLLIKSTIKPARTRSSLSPDIEDDLSQPEISALAI
jgi:hypothetical protein